MVDVEEIASESEGISLLNSLTGHKGVITQVSWAPDGKLLASASEDCTVRIWNPLTNRARKILDTTNRAQCVAWSPNSSILTCGTNFGTIINWDIKDSYSKTKFSTEYSFRINSISWSPNGRYLAVCGADSPVLILDPACTKIFKHLPNHGYGEINQISWSPNGLRIAAANDSGEIFIYFPFDNSKSLVLRGHSSFALGVVWSPDGKYIFSCSEDSTICVWDAKTVRLVSVLEGHTAPVDSLTISYDGCFLASKSEDNTVRIWSIESLKQVAVINETVQPEWFSKIEFDLNQYRLATLGNESRIVRIWSIDPLKIENSPIVKQQISYINAKAVFLGDSGVGKSALAIRVAEGIFKLTESTHGAHFYQIKVENQFLPKRLKNFARAEITVCDLAGQSEYRLVHQLFLRDTDVAIVLFSSDDTFDPLRGVGYWSKVLKHHVHSSGLKYLVSSRIDVNPVSLSPNDIQGFVTKNGFDDYFATSAKTGEGVDNLLSAIQNNLNWNQLTKVTTPILFQTIQQSIIDSKNEGRNIITYKDICLKIKQQTSSKENNKAEIDTVIALLQARGVVYRLSPSTDIDLVLLKPELINQYASAIIRAVRNNKPAGTIPEREVLSAQIPLSGCDRPSLFEERAIIESTVELIITHALCFREMGLLVFPSQMKNSKPKSEINNSASEISYRFSGAVETIYASLVVRLWRTNYFRLEENWRNASEFSRSGKRLGFVLKQIKEGTAELEIYFEKDVNSFDCINFVRFISDHLREKGLEIREKLKLNCHKCGKEILDRSAINERILKEDLYIPCQYCSSLVAIPKSFEESYITNLKLEKEQHDLRVAVREKTKEEVNDFKKRTKMSERSRDDINILHISDLHFGNKSKSRQYALQLSMDLRNELEIDMVDFIIISGDIANTASENEYEDAYQFIKTVVDDFGLDSARVIIAPGNHDVDWDASEASYEYKSERNLPKNIKDDQVIRIPADGALVRNEEKYKLRFNSFGANLYKRLRPGESYPSEYSKQSILLPYESENILILSLNTAWNIDHHYQNRASVNMESITNALEKGKESKYKDWLKIIVCHHPISREVMKDEVLELFSVAGFRILLFGHLHEAINKYHSYDNSRGIHYIGAGTFGATRKEWVSGIPLQYNYLNYNKESNIIKVHTRKREKIDGAWCELPEGLKPSGILRD